MTVKTLPLPPNEIVAEIKPAPSGDAAINLAKIGGYSHVDGIWNFQSSVTEAQITVICNLQPA